MKAKNVYWSVQFKTYQVKFTRNRRLHYDHMIFRDIENAIKRRDYLLSQVGVLITDDEWEQINVRRALNDYKGKIHQSVKM